MNPADMTIITLTHEEASYVVDALTDAISARRTGDPKDEEIADDYRRIRSSIMDGGGQMMRLAIIKLPYHRTIDTRIEALRNVMTYLPKNYTASLLTQASKRGFTHSILIMGHDNNGYVIQRLASAIYFAKDLECSHYRVVNSSGQLVATARAGALPTQEQTARTHGD